MTTRADLEWWLSLAPTLPWTFARTMPKVPHFYIVAGKTPGLDHDDFARAGRVIRAFAEPGKFWAMTQIYLFSEDRQMKFWVMWSRPFRGEDATGINMATTERTDGPQDAFDTARVRELRLPPADTDGGDNQTKIK